MPRPIGPAQLRVLLHSDNVAQFQEANRRLRVESEHTHVQDGLAIGRDCPLLGLDFDRGFLQESSHMAVAGKAEHPMPACLLRLGKASQSVNAFAVPLDFLRVERRSTSPAVITTCPWPSPRTAMPGRSAIGDRRALFPRPSRKVPGAERNLSTRSVGRQAAGVATGMDDEDPQSPQVSYQASERRRLWGGFPISVRRRNTSSRQANVLPPLPTRRPPGSATTSL